MIKFNDYTRTEKQDIIKRGGNAYRDLEKACFEWLDTLSLPEDVDDFVRSSDPILEVIGDCETEQEVIDFIKDIMQ